MNPHQADPAVRRQLATFLSWAIRSNGGNAAHFLNSVHFLPLPDSVVRLSREQILGIR